VFNATFSNISATFYIMTTSISGGRSRSPRREPPTHEQATVKTLSLAAASRVHPFL